MSLETGFRLALRISSARIEIGTISGDVIAPGRVLDFGLDAFCEAIRLHYRANGMLIGELVMGRILKALGERPVLVGHPQIVVRSIDLRNGSNLEMPIDFEMTSRILANRTNAVVIALSEFGRLLQGAPSGIAVVPAEGVDPSTLRFLAFGIGRSMGLPVKVVDKF